MQPNMILILTIIEITLLFLCIILFFFLKNRSLKHTIERLKARLEELVNHLKLAKEKQHSNIKDDQKKRNKSYLDWISEHLESTLARHKNLNPKQDILLDISPESPPQNRTAALRNALLLAEKEAIQPSEENAPDWDILQNRYDRIFKFYDELNKSSEQEAPLSEPLSEISALNDELSNARKRINNLEKFKTMYFDLEEKWQNCKIEAQTHHNSLIKMSEHLEDPLAFEQSLENYQLAYQQISAAFEGSDAHAQDNESLTTAEKYDKNNLEVQRLREVTTEQHVVISQLQQRLSACDSPEEVQQIVHSLEEELQKQTRFLSESETCIQLMEDELSNSNAELLQLRSKLNTLTQTKEEVIDLRTQCNELEIKLQNANVENKKLRKEQGTTQASTSDDNGDTTNLRKALTSMESKYNDLEEKFLDLKLQKNN